MVIHHVLKGILVLYVNNVIYIILEEKDLIQLVQNLNVVHVMTQMQIHLSSLVYLYGKYYIIIIFIGLLFLFQFLLKVQLKL